uniref:Uncharacterized protein n=1 Tax=Graphocephala atropunctata TaxID=36148 RepID=A0A1B6LJ84_9HEMI
MSVKNMVGDEGDRWKKRESEEVGARYCPRVRMGNWSEELFLQEEKIRYFLRRKDRGELLVQKTRATISNLLKEVSLLLPGDYVQFGDPCQVLAPGLCHARAPQGLVLAGVVGVQEVDTCQHYQDGSLVSGSPHSTPCVRNCFRISSPDMGCRKGDRLKYGEPFALSMYESPHGLPLFIESEVPHLHSTLGRSKHPLLRLTSYKNIYSLWRVVPLDHATREDLWNMPVPANVPVVISHVASNKNLALAPDFWFSTYFGAECEVGVHTDLNVYRRETANNVWVLVTNRPEKLQ